MFYRFCLMPHTLFMNMSLCINANMHFFNPDDMAHTWIKTEMLSYLDRSSQIRVILSVETWECCFRLRWVTIPSPSNRRGSWLQSVVERNFIESIKSHIGFFRSSLLSCCGVSRHSDNPETDLSRPPTFRQIDTSEQNQHEQCRGICSYRPQTGIHKASR